MRSVGLRTVPYVVTVPPAPGGPTADGPTGDGPRDWGFLLAARTPVPLTLAPHGPRPRSLTPARLDAARRAAERGREPDLPPSTLMRPRYGE